MAAMAKRQLTLDTNILFDLAEQRDFAHFFREFFQKRGYSLRVSPTVVQELAHFAVNKQCAETPIALKALQQMKSWRIVPWDLISAGHAITSEFSGKLIRKGYLPEGEFNDGFILAETALCEIPVLVTNDGHLANIDPAQLKLQFEDSDLAPVSVFRPGRLYEVLK
jgi:predicted nucleic acid-binding protein